MIRKCKSGSWSKEIVDMCHQGLIWAPCKGTLLVVSGLKLSWLSYFHHSGQLRPIDCSQIRFWGLISVRSDLKTEVRSDLKIRQISIPSFWSRRHCSSPPSIQLLSFWFSCPLSPTDWIDVAGYLLGWGGLHRDSESWQENSDSPKAFM